MVDLFAHRCLVWNRQYPYDVVESVSYMCCCWQPCSLTRDQTQTVAVSAENGPRDDEEIQPLVDSQPDQQPVPASEMHAISFVGALRIPVSRLGHLGCVILYQMQGTGGATTEFLGGPNLQSAVHIRRGTISK